MIHAFEEFLKTVDLAAYRGLYSPIKIVEMDLPKNIQAVQLLYTVYWDERTFLSFDDFYERYLSEKSTEIEEFRTKSTMCEDCFYRGLKARIYRTWAGLITQIHAGYVAETVFGPGTVSMSAELDHQGADIRVEYKKHFLNYQVKKTSFAGVVGRKPQAQKSKLSGESIDINYEVPSILSNPKTKKGEFRKPYLRFMEDTRTRHLSNGFVIFTEETFLPEKRKIDAERES
ncbi:TaqI family restriction endonuclease [Patescibacteria group bacterium]|nr:TaqI family restriction endonuclease [Patescibacteria group bacterium]MBU1500888.1 TaqI family restriction endonuclease [Patescibacteria group bacterium]MBU2080943.1 TaqI family restriction endonuclease [Patescibacteria group bacterium]MBU2124048.1 TaqI family restriction endonuclease [Patescibacteria group bacterium]MBU2194661.1 TaqI family restriction endonuclease [Patescibacteria group bacterium]